MNKPSRRSVLIAGGSLAALAAAAALLRPAPLVVDVATVAAGPLQVTVSDQGETRAHDRFTVAAPAAGRLMRIELHDGDAVAENQVVARIAAPPLSVQQRTETDARAAAAEALVREADDRLRHAEDDAAQATRERMRVEKLVRDGFVSPQAAERARNAETTSRNEADAARHRARAAAAEVRVARSALTAQREGGLLAVRAPAAGRVLRILEASERMVAAGTPILTIGDMTRLEIVIALLSAEAVKVAPGMPVLLERWGGSGALRARVRLVEPHAFTKVSALGIEEKRTNVIADFVDPPGPLGDGYRVDARIVIWSGERILKVPASALFRCGEAWCAFAVEDGRARRRSVQTGRRNDLEVEVAGGLAAGDTVIRFPGSQTVEGTRVRPR
jgi:HlyD family secretion protein